LARATTISPVSSGARRESRAWALYSGSSSRNSTPLWASEASPGRAFSPPPVRAAILAEWCGLRNGRSRVRAPRSISPATDQTIEVSSSSAGVRGGSRPGKRWASIDLPEPGGPTNSKLFV
tara:strand:- start:3627 stop:3989 length:363 start_codon:yes stop_codon:yes gene_type:complete